MQNFISMIINKIKNIKYSVIIFLFKIRYKDRFIIENFRAGQGFIFDIKTTSFNLNLKKVTFRDYCAIHLRNNANLYIGNNVFLNSFCSISCLKSIIIGDNTMMGENVKIYDHNHKFIENEILIKDQGYTTSPVNIGKNCWIGSNVIILKGVTIGDNSVIGAGVIVYKDVAKNTLLINKQIQESTLIK